MDTELSASDPVKVPLSAVATDDSLFMPTVGNIDTMTLRRSGRTPKPSAIVLENNHQQEEITASKLKQPFKHAIGLFTMMALVSVSCLSQTFQHPTTSIEKAVAHMAVVSQHFDGTINYLHPMALATKQSSNDTFTIKKMLKQGDHLEFIQAMMEEVDAHESRNHWSLMRRSSLSLGTKTIMSI